MFVVLPLLAAGILAVADTEPRKLNARCTVPYPVFLKLGEVTFALPKGHPLPDYTEPDIKYCQDKENVTHVVRTFSLFPGKFLPSYYGEIYIGKATQLRATYAPHSKYADPFELVQNAMKLEKVSLKKLPMENGFYIWKRTNPKSLEYGQREVFISTKLKSPNGFPVAFGCTNQFCGVGIWDKNVHFGVRQVALKSVPFEEWDKYYVALEKYRQDLMLP
jgi:hypothetical protein